MTTPLPKMEFRKDELEAKQAADLKSELFTPDAIYLELRLLKDYTIGALLSTLLDKPQDIAEAQFKAIKGRLLGYDMRLIDDTAPFFPSFNMTTDEIEAYIRDPANTEAILMMSPGTQFITAMIENLRININHSEVDERFEKVYLEGSSSRYTKRWKDVTYFVNTWPLPKPTGPGLKNLNEFFVRMFQSNVIVVSMDPKEMSRTVYDNCDEFNFYQIGRHFENTAFSDPAIRLGLKNKMVFSSMVFERSKLNPLEYNQKRFRTELEFLSAQNNLIFRYFDWVSTAYLTTDITPYLGMADEFDKEVRYEALPGLNDHVKK